MISLTHLNLQMLEYRHADRVASKIRRPLRRLTSMPNATSSDAARASRAQFRGFQHLQNLSTAVRQSLLAPSISPSPHSSQPKQASPPQPTEMERAEQDAQELAEDRSKAERELRRYKEDGLVSSEHATDLVQFWDISWFRAWLY